MSSDTISSTIGFHYVHYLILALAGCIAGFAFAPSPLGLVAFIAFVPLIVVLERRLYDHNTTRLLYTFFFCFHGAANWWVMSWQRETDPYLMAAGAGLWLGHPFFLMPAFWLYVYFRKRFSLARSLGLLTCAWAAVEWLHSLTDLSYPWLALGYTQVYLTSLIQIADIGGVWIVGFFVMLVNIIFAHWFLTRSNTTTHAIALTALFGMVTGYGVLQMRSFSSLDANVGTQLIRVGVVQPNINPWRKWRGGMTEMLTLHENLQDSLNRISPCDLSVWSETAIPIGLTLPENSSVLRRVHEWVDTSRTAVLTGFADYQFFPANAAPANAQSLPSEPDLKVRLYNSAGIIAPQRDDIPTHHKSRLTPFGEYMPFSDDFPQIQNWLKWGVGISGWNKGEGATVLPLVRGQDTLAHIGPVICIESIYPSHVADYARRGATMLAVITNDAWYDGTFGPEQHYCISRMRAVETRREIMRCGNSGVSGHIDAVGRSVQQAEARQSLALGMTIRPHTEMSLYVRFGDWLPQLCAIIVGLMFVWTRKRTTKKV